MSHFQLLDVNTAPESVKTRLIEAEKNAGFLSNLLAVLAHSPAALETYQTVSAINARSSLRLKEREVVQLVAATHNGCRFCVAGHTSAAKNAAKLKPEIIDALRLEQAIDDPHFGPLVAFARASLEQHGAVDQSIQDDFFAAGYTEQNALDVLLGLSLATLCNFANSLARTALNPQLQDYQWEKSHA
jgi:uncharacterized peroxidase-related enzyme